MTRLVVVGLVILASLASSDVARADGDPLPNGATLSFGKFYLRENGEYVEPEKPEDARRYFNAAHCACGQSGSGDEQRFAYDLTLSAPITNSRPIDVYVGETCDDAVKRPTTCKRVDSVADIDDVRTSTIDIEIPVYDAVNINTTGACVTGRSTSTAWLMVDLDGDSDYDHWVTKPIGDFDITPDGIDVEAPPLPSSISAAGSEEAIELTWEPPTSRESDLFAYQALCTTVDDQAAVPEPKTALYQRAADVCGASVELDLPAVAREEAGEDPVTAPPGFRRLDPALVCGEANTGTARSLRIGGLKNGVKYKVALLAIDAFGNVAATYFSSTITPKPAIDLWEDLNNRDSAIDGGCLLATTYGDQGPLTQALRAFRDDTLGRTRAGRALTAAYYASIGALRVESWPARVGAGIALAPLVAVALGWHFLTLPGLAALVALAALATRRARARRRRAATTAGSTDRLRPPGGRRALAAAAAGLAAALCVATPRAARADEFAPYWEEPRDDANFDEPARVRWHAGLRVGPYIPDIDLQFPRNEVTGLGPYEAMFGDWYTTDGVDDGGAPRVVRKRARVYQVLPMLDVDRIVWDRVGQLGVGGSAGYMQKRAYAYADGTDEDDPMRLRSTAARNTFRLIPLAATVTYRMTYLDDRWGIPIVPYVRAGLSYYLWWITAPNGNVAKVCDGGASAGSECADEDRALGATAGVQASAGIAIRAERVDAGAARSMRTSGIQHAGFYAEVFWGRVDGFGSETKLWVGDTTWFAGINFEL